MLTDSNIEVIWDPADARLRLVELGDPMWEEVKLDGRQAVQITEPLRSAGIKTIPRGLERHTVTFSLAVEKNTIEEAEELRFEMPLTMPKNRADVILAFASGTQFRLANASLRAWATNKQGRIAEARIEIIGGVYFKDTGSYTAANNWKDQLSVAPPQLAEDGSTLLSESGGELQNEG
ncbi:MAG: hypothetical protein AAGI48_03790 [Verrucomicrobiota bacterium]